MIEPSKQPTAALAGRLSRELEAEIERFWRSVALETGRPPGTQLRFPHLSFQLLRGGGWSETFLDVLREYALGEVPVPIELKGIGVFRTPRLVLYAAVKRTERLIRFQGRLTELLEGFGFQSHPFYRPGGWVPHISLVLDRPGRRVFPLLRNLEKNGTLKAPASIESLVLLSDDEAQPVLMDAPLGPGRVRITPGLDRGSNYR